MNTFVSSMVFFVLAAFFAPQPAHAAALEIFTCRAQSATMNRLKIQLWVDDAGKLHGGYSLDGDPMRDPGWVKVGEYTTVPRRFEELLKQLNAFKDTGIASQRVVYFQNIFIDGSGKYAVELWKLFDNEGRHLGWMANAFKTAFGCYPEPSGGTKFK